MRSKNLKSVHRLQKKENCKRNCTIYSEGIAWRYRVCHSVAQSCPALCDPMDCSIPGLSVPHHLWKFAQVHVRCIGDAIQPFHHSLMPSFPSALNLSQHLGLFQWVSCSNQVTKILEFQLQHQSFQWVFIQDWFLLRLTGLISLLSKGFSGSLLKHRS